MSEFRVYGYARVSSKTQKLDRQIAELKKAGVEGHNLFCDRSSGKDFDRLGYQTLKNALREGDTLIIKELDRLGRDMQEVKAEWQSIQTKGVTIKVLDSPFLTKGLSDSLEDTFMSNMIFELLTYVAEKERQKLKQRQAEGIKVARAKGKRFGRPEVQFPKKWYEIYQKWKVKEITAVAAMQELDLKKNTFYNLVKKYEKKGE